MITKNEKIEVCKKYKNGESTNVICKIYNIYPHNLYSILQQYNIALRGNPNKISENVINSIINDIKNGMSIKKSSEKNNVKLSTTMTLLHKKGFKSYYNEGQFRKKYDIDESFFENINSPEKSQILGLLYADGSVSSINKLVSLRLERSDEKYLESIKNCLKSNKPLYYLKGAEFISPMNKKIYKRKDTAILDITNKKIYYDIIKIGLIPRKKFLNVNIPHINPLLLKYFVLGYFEGDGCISWNIKHSVYYISICGSQNLCNDIKNIIYHQLNLRGTLTLHSSKSIWILSYKRKNDIVKIINWLYDNKSSLKMERKFKKCMEFLKFCNV